MKKIIVFFTMIVCLISISSCSGYNKKMYDYLSNSNNYEAYHIEINNFYYFNHDNNHYEILNYEKKLDSKYDKIYFSTSELEGFTGGKYLIYDSGFSDYMVLLEIEFNNYQILLENNFFEDYKLQDSLIVKTSNLIYMDSRFYYISSVTYNNKEYLNNETGLNNIIEMMDDNRSIL